jgi:predicted deacylase
MASSKGVHPTSSEVEAHVLKLRQRHPRLVEAAVVSRSQQGRPIYAVTVTAPDVPDADKQHALLVAGEHGNEESSRMLALATLDWLVSRAGAPTRAKQKVVVLPCVNPDATDADSHLTPGGADPNLDHGLGGAKTPEGRAVEAVAEELMPELLVNLHARGYTGCSYDMVLYPPVKDYTEDDNVHHAIAMEMAQAAERAGIPQVVHPLSWPGWGGSDPNYPGTSRYAYREFKSVSFLTETCEDNSVAYPAAERVRSGLAKIQVVLAHGNRRHPKLYYGGYPCQMVVGMFLAGIVAVGTTAAQRRASRVAAWRNRHEFRSLDRYNPEKLKAKRLLLDYVGRPLPEGIGIQTFAKGRLAVKSVRIDGRRLKASQTDGHYTWHDGCATYVVAVIRDLRPGKYELSIRYE